MSLIHSLSITYENQFFDFSVDICANTAVRDCNYEVKWLLQCLLHYAPLTLIKTEDARVVGSFSFSYYCLHFTVYVGENKSTPKGAIG